MKYSLTKKTRILISLILCVLYISSAISTAKAADVNVLALNDSRYQGTFTAVSYELTVKSSTPADNAKNVPLNKPITITFSEEIRECSEFSKIILHKVGSTGNVPVEGYISKDTLAINPLYSLDYNSTYMVVVPRNSILGVNGKILNGNCVLFFETEKEKIPPEVKYSYPSTDSRYVPINSTIAIAFSENINPFEDFNKGVTLRDSKNNIDIRCSVSGNTMTINLKNGLNMAYKTAYTLTVSSGTIKDFEGNTMKQNYVLKFTTEAWGTSPKLVSSNPTDGSKNAPINNSITVSFDENIRKGKNFSKIYLENEKGEKVTYSTSISDKTLTIKPKWTLDYDTTYNLVIPVEAIEGTFGKVSKDKYEIKFKTDKEKFPPKIKYIYPSEGSNNVAVDSTINVFFDEIVQKGFNFENIVLRDSNYNYIPISYELNDKHISIKLKNDLNMSYNTKYTLRIPYKAVKDMAENEFLTTCSYTFTTGKDRFCPIVKYVEPDSNSKEIPIDSKIKVVLNDKITKGENFSSILLKSDDKNIESNISIYGDSITLTPSKPLENDKQYKVIIPVGAIKDSFGNTMKYEFASSFTTAKEKILPYIENVTPAPGSVNVDTKSAITFDFSENIKRGKDFDKISLSEGTGKSIPYSIEVKGKSIVITPKSSLNYGEAYSIKIPVYAVVDMADNHLREEAYTYFLTKGEEEKKVVKPSKPVENNKNLLKVSKYQFSRDYSMVAVYFSENIAADKDIKRAALKDSSGRIIGAPIGMKNNMLVIRARIPLSKGKSYSIYIPKNAVKGKSGKKMNSDYIQRVTRK